MNAAAVTSTKEISVAKTETPPIASPIDAEVDVEVLRMVPKHFCIEDEASANWLVKKIVSARAYADRIKLWADLELRRAEREERTLLFLFGRQIETWTRAEIGKLHNHKSINLPAGAIGFRTINAALQVDDEDVVLGWARKRLPAAVIIAPKLSRSILKDHFEKTGEMPDAGVHVEPAAEKFYIR